MKRLSKGDFSSNTGKVKEKVEMMETKKYN